MNGLKSEPFVSFVGGSRSGKTYNLLQYLLMFEQKKHICVIKDTLINVRQTILPEFKDIVEGEQLSIKSNETQRKYIVNNNMFHFTAFPTAQSAKGYSCDILLVDEADGINKEIIDQLKLRLKEKMIITYNPSSQFWANEYQTPKNTLITTFKTNPFLTKMQYENFERIKKIGLTAPEGSYERNYYLTFYEGIFTNLFSSEPFTTTDLTFADFDVPKSKNTYSVADPSFGVGANYFACPSVFLKDGILYCYDILLSPFVNTDEYSNFCKLHTFNFIERNGIGAGLLKNLTNTYNVANVGGFNSNEKKEKRIFENLDGIKKVVFHKKLLQNSEFIRCIDRPKKIAGYHLDLQDALASTVILKNKGYFI